VNSIVTKMFDHRPATFLPAGGGLAGRLVLAQP